MNRNLIAAAAIVTCTFLGVGTVWYNAPARHTVYAPAEQEFTAAPTLSTPPRQLSEAWTHPDTWGGVRPVLIDGVIATADGGKVTGLNPTTGETLWSYSRNLDVCSLAASFHSIVATYRNAAGCGDVTALSSTTGKYHATRSSEAPTDVWPISSHDAVGTYNHERLELWRSDLVRTVEYGDKPIKAEPNLQPHEDCTIQSAGTRKDLVAVVETCPEAMLRYQKRVPEDSREPKITRDIAIPGTDAQLVAIGQTGAAVYVAKPTPRILSFVSEHPLVFEVPPASQPDSRDMADLPHHMTWFDGNRLYLFKPEDLSITHSFDNALGTGTAVGDRLLFPTKEGIAVADWKTGEIEYTIPIDRGSHNGHVSLALVGDTIVEKRGEQLVGLR
ncbi:Rv3212 family protein [Corynebacterium freiburgense]|uniref:Rv3212 family protein n=1 Tax=Corynebacterium freiburgense TaxID=556548 RepID=UPI000426E994|nr:PQQ-binding-like beta-propeller repeat protein [Corynebacterium freiburgense]WJZ01939.1 hypothetical protein CFREI_03175 [Corynebacterium freiburgense]